MEEIKRYEDIIDEEGKIYCKYCHRELPELSPYSVEKELPMCRYCEVKHREFETLKKLKGWR